MSMPISDSMEQILDRFDEAWNEPSPPSIEDYLATSDPVQRLALLVELIRIDLERRLAAGERVRLEEAYLLRFPELSSDKSAIAELVKHEFEVRHRNEPNLTPAEYLERFPQCQTELMAQLPTLDEFPSRGQQQDTASPRSLSPSRGVLAIGERFGDYELLEELGRGGMGVVYKARQVKLNRVVAFKAVLRADVENRQRFHVEARALARLQHPNIVQIYEIGEHQGQPFFALEFVEGGTLAERAARQPLSGTEAAKLTAVLAHAVHAAHEAKVIHRDLKPANILLTLDGTPKISDFGLAKHLDAETVRTQSGAIFGTPAYMSPEQASGQSKSIGPAADIHALGVILYELLAGQVPFRGMTVLDVLQQVQSAEPISLRRLVPKLPHDLETICHKCLRKAPEERYRSALELAEDLERYLEGQPIRARPVPAFERGIKWTRRHPTTVALLAVIVLVAAVLTSSFHGKGEDPSDIEQEFPAGGNWVLRVKKVRATGENVPVAILCDDKYATLQAEKIYAEITSENRQIKRMKLQRAHFQSTRWAPHVLQRVPSLQVTIDMDIDVADNRATLIPTWVEMRIPLEELTQHINNQIRPGSFSLPISTLHDFRWQIIRPKLGFEGRTIFYEMDISVSCLLKGQTGDVPLTAVAHLQGDCKHSLKEASKFRDQQFELRLNVKTLQWKSVDIPGHPDLAPAVRKVLELLTEKAKAMIEKPVVLHPFREADSPVQSLAENVIVRDFVIHLSDDKSYDKSVGLIILRANCKKRQ
jgi:tRNA A-37 threonylcarbamoyl transferase component Bud32